MTSNPAAFAGGHARGSDPDALVRDCLEQMGGLPAEANLGIAYATDALDGDLGPILAALRRETGIDMWAGTLGYGVCANGAELFDTPALAVLAGAVPDDGVRLLPTLATPGERLAEGLEDWITQRRPSIGLVHADPRNAYVTEIIQALGDDTDAFVVGGLTASRREIHQLAGEVTEGGLSGLLFADDFSAVSGLSQGCAPVGPVHQVTEARENLLVTLDGRRALEVLVEDLGVREPREFRQALANIHVAMPIADGEPRDYLVRNLMGLDPESGVLAVGERLRDGDRLMFVRRDAASAMADLEMMLDDIMARAGAPPRAAIYVSCIARGPNLFGRNSEELGMIAERIGDAPLVGFFANGEIFNTRLYTYTGVLTLIL